MPNVYCFGDSWGAGAELRHRQQPFVHWVGETLEHEAVNKSTSGDSLGVILKKVERHATTLTKDDVVLIVIPPDVRWYSEKKGQFYTIGLDLKGKEYRRFLGAKSKAWFEYHHVLFIYTLQNLLKDIGCKFLLAHNYRRLPDFNEYGFAIDQDIFLSPFSLTYLLSTSEEKASWDNYNTAKDGPVPEMFSGKYFKGTVNHPNQLGHKKIAELICKRLKEKYE